MKIVLTYNNHLKGTPREVDYDVTTTVASLCEIIQKLGYEAIPFEFLPDLAESISRLIHTSPDLIFNIGSENLTHSSDAFYPALFEKLGLRHVGSNSHGALVALDKNLTKLQIAKKGIPTPNWITVNRELDFPSQDKFTLNFPVIAKPTFGESSKGINVDSIFESYADLAEGYKNLLKQSPAGLLIETFVEGREITVPYISGLKSTAEGSLLPLELKFASKQKNGKSYSLYDYDIKHNHHETMAVQIGFPEDLGQKTIDDLRRYTSMAAHALGLLDYCRVDYRITPDKQIYFLEVNSLPTLQLAPPTATIFLAARLSNLMPSEVISAIICSALSRYSICKDNAMPHCISDAQPYTID